MENLPTETNSTSVQSVVEPNAAADVKAASKADDISSSSEEVLPKEDSDDDFDFLNMIQTPQFHHPHHRAPFQVNIV